MTRTVVLIMKVVTPDAPSPGTTVLTAGPGWGV
jgi:hypothetical protein